MRKESRLEKKIMVSQGNFATYALGPFVPEIGRALGNALRRVLLASLPGAAVTSIRIEGVLHEFQDIPNVWEDVTQMVFNVKKLRLRSFSDHPISLHLEVSGECEVTAADIIAPGTVEIINPELHLATLDNEDARLMMVLTVESGRGFVPGAPKEDQPRGVLPVDAIYTPVQKVGYTVERKKGEQTTESESLVLAITTDGTMTSDEALRQAAEILVKQFQVFAAYQPGIEETGFYGLSTVPIPPKIYQIPLEELDLSPRVYHALHRKGIRTVGHILSMTEEDLLGKRNFGETGLAELKEKVWKKSFCHRMLPTPSSSRYCRHTSLLSLRVFLRFQNTFVVFLRFTGESMFCR